MTGTTRVLVVGGTGRQGRAVVDNLRERTVYEVSVLTRRPESDPARELSRSGVSVVEGDLLDRASIAWALERVDRAFFITDYPPGSDPAVECQQGQNMVDAAVAADLDHLVYSSTIDATIARGVPHFDAKAAVEATVRAAEVPTTVLRPAPFYQNIETFAGAVGIGILPFPIDGATTLPMVDVRDIGRAAATVLSNPETHTGTVHRVVAGGYTLAELAASLATAHGVTVTPVTLPLSVVRRLTDESVAAMFAWFRRYGQFRQPTDGIDIEYRSFEQFVDSAEAPAPTGWLAKGSSPLRPPFGQP